MDARTYRWLRGNVLLVFSCMLLLTWISKAQGVTWDLKSDTWVATDALGRRLPGFPQCGAPDSDKKVMLFYLTWLGKHVQSGPHNISYIMDQNSDALEDPDDELWGPDATFHWWGEPELGYYRSLDPYVIRKHMEMIIQAGVEVIVFDATNSTYDSTDTANQWVYFDEWDAICDTLEDMSDEGMAVPKICFYARYCYANATYKWGLGQHMQRIYDDWYDEDLHEDLWFELDGKPLFLLYKAWANDPDPTQTLQDFFTIREMSHRIDKSTTWWDTGEDQWPWHDDYLQDYGWHVNSSTPEETSVSIAMQRTYMTVGYPDNMTAHGRHYHDGSQPSSSQWDGSGDYFAEQWDGALGIDPDFIFINEWNEWVAQKLVSGTHDGGTVVPNGYVFFVDLFTQEYSRDIEPMKNGHTDNYYYQMVDGVRRFKGVPKPETPSDPTTITIDGSFSDWTSIEPEFRDSIGDTLDRNYNGYASAGTYTKTSGRNDIIASKVAYDSSNVYFYAETDANLTSYTGSDWMLLYINSDSDFYTGWQGYDFIVNSSVGSSTATTLKYWNGSSWVTESSSISYRASGTQLEISIPRSDLGLGGDSALDFEFHWCDNIGAQSDITKFFTEGDSAPDRRFNYRYYVRSPETEIDLGADNTRQGLRIVDFGDGETVAATIGGRDCRRNDVSGSDCYMYFDVDDLFVYGNRGYVDVLIEYYDTGTGTIGIRYDSTSGAYTDGGSVTLGNTNQWKTHVFQLSNVKFEGNQNGYSDFRLVKTSGYYYIDKVKVAWAEKSPDVDLGTTNSGLGVVQVDVAGEGDTEATTIGGTNCRKTATTSDYYMYFEVDDYFTWQQNKPDLFVTVDYYDTGNSGSLALQYDSPGSTTADKYKESSHVCMAGTNTWKTHTFHITDGYFGDRQGGDCDFRLAKYGGGYAYVDQVTVSWDEGMVDLGTTDVNIGVNRVNPGDGDTEAVTIGGRDCRKNLSPAGGDYYIYFNVDDLLAYRGSETDIYITVGYYDTGTGTIYLVYDSSSAAYTGGGGLTLRNTNRWKYHTFHVTNAYFGNRQNKGADMRFFRSDHATTPFYLDTVAVSTEAPEGPSNDLRTTNVCDRLSHQQPPDGTTIGTTIGSVPCRRNYDRDATPGDQFFYFRIEDSAYYQGGNKDVYITINYYDTGSGTLLLQYDSDDGDTIPAKYKSGGSVALTNTNTWKRYTYHVLDGYFGQRQNSGSDFRFAKTNGGYAYINRVQITESAP